MNSDLVVVTFVGEKDAWKAESALKMMNERQPLGVQYAATLTKDSNGQVEISLRGYLPLNLKDNCFLLLIQLANAFFGNQPAASARLVEAGIDKHLVEQLKSALVPGSSALIIYSPPEILTDSDRLETVLSLFRGRIYHATFPAQVGNAILAPETKPSQN